jgi:hydroxymethylpyrimidine pyrophosphatase-like HAD family hydrolase
LERELAEKLSMDILENGNGELLISTAWTQFVIPKEDRFFYHMRDTVRVQVERISDISEVKDPILKVSMFRENGLTDVTPWRERYGSLCTVQTSGSDWLDMTPKDVNKATAMEVLLNHLGIKPSECMAFGDNENDAPLLAMAGYPIAMSDATPDILKMVSQTTDSVEAVLREMVR